MTDRIYQSPQEPGPILTAVENALDEEAATSVRIAMIADAFDEEYSWQQDGVGFVATPAHLVRGGSALQLTVVAVDLATGDLLSGLDNPYEFAGPVPIMVPDGTWRKELVSRLDPETNEDVDVEEDIPNFVEDPVLALQACITAVVINQARHLGWGQT